MEMPDNGKKRKPKNANGEQFRRWRLGELRRLYRDRHGSSVLPDDDAGREYLRELLLLASMAFNPDRNMRNVLSQAAPWMDKAEAEGLFDDINQTPIYLRKPSARILGDRVRLTSEERQRNAIRTIKPFDRTDAELELDRKARDSERQWRKRRAAEMTPREAWLANRWSRLKPWERRRPPISRATWYREGYHKRGAAVRQVRETGVSRVKINTVADRPVSGESQRSGKSRKGVVVRKAGASERKAARG